MNDVIEFCVGNTKMYMYRRSPFGSGVLTPQAQIGCGFYSCKWCFVPFQNLISIQPPTLLRPCTKSAYSYGLMNIQNGLRRVRQNGRMHSKGKQAMTACTYMPQKQQRRTIEADVLSFSRQLLFRYLVCILVCNLPPWDPFVGKGHRFALICERGISQHLQEYQVLSR